MKNNLKGRVSILLQHTNILRNRVYKCLSASNQWRDMAIKTKRVEKLNLMNQHQFYI